MKRLIALTMGLCFCLGSVGVFAKPGKPIQTMKITANADQKKQTSNRSGKQARLRSLADDPKQSKADRGWIKQDINAVRRGNRNTLRNPPGKDLAHARGREASKGYDYEYANLKPRDLHKKQHQFDKYGRLNKEDKIRH